jgi:DNA-binding response OmpR family regulator
MASIRMLVVDDETEFLEPLLQRLKRRGVECTGATSGEEAVELLKKTDYDVAVVDVKMPGMNGLDLLRWIRREKPATAVILLTGHASVELGIQGMELGAFEYLLKPVDVDELLDVAHRASAGVKLP